MAAVPTFLAFGAAVAVALVGLWLVGSWLWGLFF
jgi:hypothetical protein